MSTRVRSRPQLLQHEQEERYYRELEAADIWAATLLSTQPPDSELSDTDSGTEDEKADEEEEKAHGAEPFDEQIYVARLGLEERKEWNEATAADEQAGWEQRCADAGRHQFSPGNQQTGCLLPDTVVTPQRESYARIGRSTPRWWPHLAWFMIDVAVNNAYTLHKLRADRKLSPTQFREQLMHGLVGQFTQRKKRGRPEKVRIRAGELHHLPMKLQQEAPCVVCLRGRKRKQGQHKPRTREGCETCGCACHFACWKQHLPVESEEDE